MSNIDYIINLCFDISEQGKTPSVALIRSMAQYPLAIPEVIKGLQNWKSNSNSRPKFQKQQMGTVSTNTPSLEQRLTQLESQVVRIMQEMAKKSNGNGP